MIDLAKIKAELFDWLWRRDSMKANRGQGISIIIPFRSPSDGPSNPRVKNLEWLLSYWESHLPEAQIIIGHDPDEDLPFSKSAAVNNGAAKATGDILVIVDADCYIDTLAVIRCADEIRAARKKNQRLWFVPYRRFYRLNEDASKRLLAADWAGEFLWPDMPGKESVLVGANDPNIGHWYGAMIQIVPCEAFGIVGGWDTRFRGWGGEDHAAMRATDTLYWPHKTLPTPVFHVWHPMIGPNGSGSWVHSKERMWENQAASGVNDQLSWRYYGATGRPERMRALLDECHKHRHHRRRHPKPPHHHRCSV